MDEEMITLPPNTSSLKCDRLSNNTYVIVGSYEGIPQNIIINTIGWVVLLFLFSILRKIAWDYGRLALVSRQDSRKDSPKISQYNVWTSLFYGNKSSLSSSQESLDFVVHQQDQGMCSWISGFFRVSDNNILEKSGRDAMQYLTFQRYLIVYIMFVTIMSLAIILPLNFQGNLEVDTRQFAHTTIGNIGPDSPMLWAHSIMAVVFYIVSILFMRHFSVHLQYEEDDKATRTLMITNIPKDCCFKNNLQQHFREAYPQSPCVDIQFAYNISRLVHLDKQRQRALEGLRNSEIIYKETNDRPLMLPYACGSCCTCCTYFGCRQVDAMDYYTQEETHFRLLCEEEKANAFKNTLGIAFVTFPSSVAASDIHRDFKVSCVGAHNPMCSSISRELGVPNWEVHFAPSPSNIMWENLSISHAAWWVRAILINFFLFLLLFFLTTPSIVLSLINGSSFNSVVQQLTSWSPIFSQFIPTLLLWTVSALLPVLVYYSDQWIGHWTRTSEHHNVMRKTFFFLILMILVLPSLGLTSAKALAEYFLSKEEKISFRWRCIFLPDNGAFFVNYVITSAMIGMAAELIRFSELFTYTIRIMFAKSAAERTAVRRAVLWEFQFGVQYAWMLLVFSIIMMFSILCPLITPFGLVYLFMKHMIDRYNIYFAYGPSKIDKHIHATAINFVIIAHLLLLFAVAAFIYIKTRNQHYIFLFTAGMFNLCMIIYVGRIFFGWFKHLSPISYTKNEGSLLPTSPPEQRVFIPEVLNSAEGVVIPENLEDQPLSNQYGATSDSPPLSFSQDDDRNVLF